MVVRHDSANSLSRSTLEFSFNLVVNCWRIGISSSRKGASLLPTLLATSETHCTKITSCTLSLHFLIKSMSCLQSELSWFTFRIAANAPTQLQDFLRRLRVPLPSTNDPKMAFISCSLLNILGCLRMIKPNFLKMSVRISKHSSRR